MRIWEQFSGPEVSKQLGPKKMEPNSWKKYVFIFQRVPFELGTCQQLSRACANLCWAGKQCIHPRWECMCVGTIRVEENQPKMTQYAFLFTLYLVLGNLRWFMSSVKSWKPFLDLSASHAYIYCVCCVTKVFKVGMGHKMRSSHIAVTRHLSQYDLI